MINQLLYLLIPQSNITFSNTFFLPLLPPYCYQQTLLNHRLKRNSLIQEFSNRALDIALSGRLEEGQIVKAAISLKKLGTPDEVIKFISEAMNKYPKLANNSRPSVSNHNFISKIIF